MAAQASSEDQAAGAGPVRRPLGRVTVPIRFGDQVIASLLFNHDANPVHHKPDHAVQWMMGLLSTSAVSGGDPALAQAGPEERTYALGTSLLQRQDVVVMPGAALAAICCERFVRPEELAVSFTTTFTYPLLVPTKGGVDVTVEAFEAPAPAAGVALGLAPRKLLIEAFGPSLTGGAARLARVEALVYPAGSPAEDVYQAAVAPEFRRLSELSNEKPGLPGLAHPAVISGEDQRRYNRIVGLERPTTPAAWQAKIPRVLTEMIDCLRAHAGYQAEVKAYYEGRADEVERRAAIARYVAKELKYRNLDVASASSRAEELAALTQQLYARQYTVFDPRLFLPGAVATLPPAPFILDLRLYEYRLRRQIHRFYTGARMQDRPVFMGEALTTAQPLVTRELANFLCETNYSFDRLHLFEYRR